MSFVSSVEWNTSFGSITYVCWKRECRGMPNNIAASDIKPKWRRVREALVLISLSLFLIPFPKNRKSADRWSAITENTAAVAVTRCTVAIDGRSRLPKRRTGLEQKRDGNREGDREYVWGGERKREGKRRVCRKRILTGTAVIWRALCATIVERRAEKRKTRDDVRFSWEHSIRLYIMRRNKTRQAFSLRGSSRALEKFVCVYWYRWVSERPKGDSINTGYCGQPIVVTSETFARDKLHTSTACVPMQFQRTSLRICRISHAIDHRIQSYRNNTCNYI